MTVHNGGLAVTINKISFLTYLFKPVIVRKKERYNTSKDYIVGSD